MVNKEVFVKIAKFVFNPHFLLCFGLAWLITNGWSYIMFGAGAFFEIDWMVAIAGAYLAFLWLPISPEKIVTVAIAMGLLQWIFPDDERTLGILKELHAKAKAQTKKRKAKKNEDQD